MCAHGTGNRGGCRLLRVTPSPATGVAVGHGLVCQVSIRMQDGWQAEQQRLSTARASRGQRRRGQGAGAELPHVSTACRGTNIRCRGHAEGQTAHAGGMQGNEQARVKQRCCRLM